MHLDYHSYDLSAAPVLQRLEPVLIDARAFLRDLRLCYPTYRVCRHLRPGYTLFASRIRLAVVIGSIPYSRGNGSSGLLVAVLTVVARAQCQKKRKKTKLHSHGLFPSDNYGLL